MQPNPDTFKQLIVSKYPDGVSSDGTPYKNMDATELTKRIVSKYPDGVTNGGVKYADYLNSQPAPQPEKISSVNPAKESLSGLTNLYGGGKEGIANKLKEDIQSGAQDLQKGNIVKGILKAGGRTAGDVAGAIFAPVGAAIGATGVGKVFDKIGQGIATSKGGLIDAITNIPAVQKFAVSHPNAAEDFQRLLNLGMAQGEASKIEPRTARERTGGQIKSMAPDILTKDVEALRTQKVAKGLTEQNTRLKTAEKSFNENTVTRTDESGNKTRVTPIDTFGKYGIAPEVDKGTIRMGDYKQGIGELGKIKEHVSNLEDEVGKKLPDTNALLNEFKGEAMKQIRNSPELKQSGKVQSTAKKLDGIFNDYQRTYGKTIPIKVIHDIRKLMNKDYNPETVDTSKAIGDAARKIVYDTTPDNSVKNLLHKEGELLAAKKYAETINGTKVRHGRIGNYALRTAGAIIGATVNKLPIAGPVLGMLGGEYAARALQQTQFKSPMVEAKALLQRFRSNKYEPSQSANAIPNKAVIDNKIPLKPILDKGNQIKKVEGAIPNKLTPYDTPEIIKARAEQKTQPETVNIKSPERSAMKRDISKKLYGEGASNKNRRADIVMGLPASGKSSMVVKPLADKHGSLIVDADMAKELLPEFKGGSGAMAVHKESAQIIEKGVLRRALKNGDNIVWPTVGKTKGKLVDFIENLKKRGYEVNLHHVNLPPPEAASRAVKRFKDTGRFVDPNYVLNEVGLKPKQNYDILKSHEGIKTATEYNSNVPKGEKPKITRHK